MKILLIKAIYHFLFCICYKIPSSDSDDNTNEQYLEQVPKNGKMFEDIVLTVARTTVCYHNNFLVKEPCRNSPHTGCKFIIEVLNGNDRCSYEIFWMEKHVFCKLCDRLRSYSLTATKGVNLEEAVHMFLMILGHNLGNRMVQEQFQHSGEIVSCQFEHVLKAMMKLASE